MPLAARWPARLTTLALLLTSAAAWYTGPDTSNTFKWGEGRQCATSWPMGVAGQYSSGVQELTSQPTGCVYPERAWVEVGAQMEELGYSSFWTCTPRTTPEHAFTCGTTGDIVNAYSNDKCHCTAGQYQVDFTWTGEYYWQREKALLSPSAAMWGSDAWDSEETWITETMSKPCHAATSVSSASWMRCQNCPKGKFSPAHFAPYTGSPDGHPHDMNQNVWGLYSWENAVVEFEQAELLGSRF